MSKTTIYRCDRCGDESTKVRDWYFGVDVGAYWGGQSNQRVVFVHGVDLCPKCMEHIEREIRETGDRILSSPGGDRG